MAELAGAGVPGARAGAAADAGAVRRRRGRGRRVRRAAADAEGGGVGAAAVYTHGGSYVHPLVAEQWWFIDRMARGSGVTLTVPLYRLAPEGGVGRAYDFLRADLSGPGPVRSGDPGRRLSRRRAGPRPGVAYRDAGLPAPRQVVLFAPVGRHRPDQPGRRAAGAGRPGAAGRRRSRACGRLWAGEHDHARPDGQSAVRRPRRPAAGAHLPGRARHPGCRTRSCWPTGCRRRATPARSPWSLAASTTTSAPSGRRRRGRALSRGQPAPAGVIDGRSRVERRLSRTKWAKQMLVAKDLEVRAGARLLLERASFQVAAGDKIGLVGPQRGRQDHADPDPGRRGPAGGRHGEPRPARSATCPRTRGPVTSTCSPRTASCPPAGWTRWSSGCAGPSWPWATTRPRCGTRR